MKCPICAKTFTPRDKRQKFCSVGCREVQIKNKRLAKYALDKKGKFKPQKKLDCAICGTEFLTSHATKVTCSAECQRLRNIQAASRSQARNRKRKTPPKIEELPNDLNSFTNLWLRGKLDGSQMLDM